MTNTSTGKEKKKIKSIIYLDEYKMYSISSQIFEGLTESITNYSRNVNEDQESQKGPAGSGRVLADIISRESSTEERKFLHDYSYSLFEEKVMEEGRVLRIDSDNINDSMKNIGDYDFVIVKGKVLFNDIKLINGTIDNIDTLMKSFARILVESDEGLLHQYKNELAEANKSIKNLGGKGKNSGGKSFSIEESNKNHALAAVIEKLGWNSLNSDLLDSLSAVLSYGYADQFETRTYLTSADGISYLFSTLLKRDHLREAEDLIVKKYSRFSEKDFSILGMVTQNSSHQLTLPIMDSSNEMRELVMQMTLALSEMERQFTGKLSNEIMVDPIAIYREL